MVSREPPQQLTRSQRVHELGLKLIALAAVTAATFAVTEAFAAQRRQAARIDAARLYTGGAAALRGGNTAAALTLLRGASTRDRANDRYALEYARALAAAGDRDGATRALLTLRERLPDSPEVNLELARLSAAAGDAAGALRYYRYALYAPWPDDQRPRQVRYELVRFLLDRGDRTRAASELLAARATIPDSAPSHLELGRLFLQAGDPVSALAEFERTLALDDANQAARGLAGEAAYRAGDYAAAVRHLTIAGAGDAAREGMRATAVSVLRDDPLAARIPPAERRDRMVRLLTRAANRAAACGADAAQLRPHDTLTAQVRRSGGRDTEVLEQGVDTAARVIADAPATCGPAAPQDRAIAIIAERHQAATP